MLTRRDLTVAIALGVIAALMVYALAQLDVAALSWTPALAPFAAGLFVGFRAGQYARGFSHSRGIWRSHKAAIRGGHR